MSQRELGGGGVVNELSREWCDIAISVPTDSPQTVILIP